MGRPKVTISALSPEEHAESGMSIDAALIELTEIFSIKALCEEYELKFYELEDELGKLNATLFKNTQTERHFYAYERFCEQSGPITGVIIEAHATNDAEVADAMKDLVGLFNFSAEKDIKWAQIDLKNIAPPAKSAERSLKFKPE